MCATEPRHHARIALAVTTALSACAKLAESTLGPSGLVGPMQLLGYAGER